MRRNLFMALLMGGAVVINSITGAVQANASATAGAAVVMDELKAGQTLKGERETLAPGVAYYTLTGKTWGSQPLRGHVVEMEPAGAKMELYLALGGDALGKTETLSSLASRHGALAAVNGGFFDTATGHPIGGLVHEGHLVSQADFLRTSVGVVGKGELRFGYFNPGVALDFGGGRVVAADAVNSLNTENGAILFTPDWGSRTGINRSGTEVIVAAGESGYVVEEISRGNSDIPRTGFVLFLPEDSTISLQNIGRGTPVKMTVDFGARWQGLRNLITGGPLLVDQGLPVLQAEVEGFRGSLLEQAPRTALGLGDSGKIMLVEVDGRLDNWSAGLTMEELAYLMADLGARQAVALDGGGSSAIWVRDRVVNRPSAGNERALANALLLLPDQIPVYLDGKRLFFDVPPLLDKGRTFVPMRGIFEALGAQIDWDEETKRVQAVKDGRTITLTIDKSEAYVDGRAVTLDAPARVVDSRTLVPLRFVGEALGAGVTWQGSPQAVLIDSSGEAAKEAGN